MKEYAARGSLFMFAAKDIYPKTSRTNCKSEKTGQPQKQLDLTA